MTLFVNYLEPYTILFHTIVLNYTKGLDISGYLFIIFLQALVYLKYLPDNNILLFLYFGQMEEQRLKRETKEREIVVTEDEGKYDVN